MKLRYTLLLFCPLLLLFCCKKEHITKTPAPACFDFAVADSTVNSLPIFNTADNYLYNNSRQLIKHIAYSGGTTVTWSDSFAYDNSGHMTKSWMSLNNNNSANYYTRSEYDYTDSLVTASRYYLGNTLLVHSVYGYDAKGELTTYTQYTDNTSLQTEPTYTYTATYDNNGNLTTLSTGGSVVARYLDYDNYPNPYYRMPYDYAYDIFSYFKSFSKHNYGLVYGYTAGYWNYNTYIAPDSTSNTYTFSYANGQVSQIRKVASYGYVSNGPGQVDILSVRSLCNLKP